MIENTIHLLIACPDRRGIIASVAGFIGQYDGNILDADQHVDPEHATFFMRVEIEESGFRLTPADFDAAWRPFAARFDMAWQVHWGRMPKRMAIMVSRTGHCLADLLWRHRHGELRVEIPLVISNHADLEGEARGAGIAFHHIPIEAGDKSAQESCARALLDAARVDVVVLARYMQVLSPEFVAAYPNRLINIHHSFLPAFSGARPYQQAYERGVKIIGATSHYVTDVLDEGPIIAQRTLNVDHRDDVADLVRKGRDLERMVLAEAVRLHAEDRILTSGNKTVVFS
jgi:formyltetrahydrofolate deformylase